VLVVTESTPSFGPALELRALGAWAHALV
jgi:hypothetical protein